MIVRALALTALAALAACGAEGPPKRPVADPPPEPGITISGTAEIGVVVQ